MRIVRETQSVNAIREERVVKATRSGEVYQINVEGGAGAGSTIEVTAGQALSGHRCVIIDDGAAYYADASDTSHAGRVVGITTGAIADGDSGPVQFTGEMIEGSFSFVPGPVYLSTGGLLTQTAPVAGFVCQVANALSATHILIAIHLPIII